MRIAQIGNELADLADALVLARMALFADFGGNEVERGAQLLQMLARFVHGFATLPRRMPAFFQGRLNFFAKDALQTVRG